MEFIKISEEVYLFKFFDVGYNILVLIHDNKALIFDTAFPEPAKIVYDELTNKGIEPEVVVFSHFHPDHICGSAVFDNCLFYGSEYYKDNYENSKLRYPLCDIMQPTNLIKDGDSLHFGNNVLKFFYTPGHSKCSISTLINNEILHVGDLVMMSNKGKAILPLVCSDGSFEEYINSLLRIKSMDISTIIPVHGEMVKGRDSISDIIDDRLYYLNKVRSSYGNLGIEDCLKRDVKEYENLNWHELNVESI